jgi:hypothetical protein
MGLLGRKKLLEKEKLEVVKVDLGKDESGEEIFVYVKQMTGRERDVFERSLTKEKRDIKGKIVDYEQNLEDFRAKLAVRTVCDENGVLLLDAKDYLLLSQNMSAAKLEVIINKAQELNKISTEDKEALIKNLEADPDGNFNSGFAENLE